MRRLFIAFPVLLALAGCAAAGGAPKTSETPRRDLAARPSYGAASTPVPGVAASSTPGSDGGANVVGSSTSSAATGGATGSPGATRSGAGAPFHDFATLTDPSGDAGIGAPAY